MIRNHIQTVVVAFVLGVVVSPMKSTTADRFVAVLAKEWPLVATLAAVNLWHAREAMRLRKTERELQDLIDLHVEDFVEKNPDDPASERLARDLEISRKAIETARTKAGRAGFLRRLREAEDANREGGFRS